MLAKAPTVQTPGVDSAPGAQDRIKKHKQRMLAVAAASRATPKAGPSLTSPGGAISLGKTPLSPTPLALTRVRAIGATAAGKEPNPNIRPTLRPHKTQANVISGDELIGLSAGEAKELQELKRRESGGAAKEV